MLCLQTVESVQSFSDTGARSCNATLCSEDLHVQMSQAAGGRQSQFDHSFSVDRVAIKVVKQRTVLVVVRHQPQLGPRSIICARTRRVAVESNIEKCGKKIITVVCYIEPLLSAAMNPRMFSWRSMIV